VEIILPPLRDRGREEILALARHFTQVYGKRHDRGTMHLPKGSEELLASYPWPGNVRELEHAIERAVVMAPGDVLEPELLGIATGIEGPKSAPGGKGVTLPLGLPLQEVERRYVEATLASMKGNRTKAAQALGVGRNTLKRKEKKLRS
jgi:Nif-specific regulatory protein